MRILRLLSPSSYHVFVHTLKHVKQEYFRKMMSDIALKTQTAAYTKLLMIRCIHCTASGGLTWAPASRKF